MTETFNFDFFQIPHTGVQEPDLAGARSDVNVVLRRPVDMKISNFGALEVGGRFSSDYTRIDNMKFKDKDGLSDVNVITEDTGVGQNVRLNRITVTHNPYLWGSTVKFTRDDQFIRMVMDRNTGSSSAATSVEAPAFDVMDTNLVTAEGMVAASNSGLKNWPSEGWRSFGGKYDFLPYVG